MIRTNKIDFLAIQETKLEDISESLCYGLWGSYDCEWVHLPSEGRSGGILSIWSKPNNSLIFSFKGEGFVGVCLEWGPTKTICFIVNVYSKCDIISKRNLWSSIITAKRGLGDGRWCVVGDFNAVCSMEERVGVNANDGNVASTEIIEFRNFVEELELVDLPILGRRFTWYHASGNAMSRIDRILISDEWAHKWGNAALWGLSRDVSDHCPLILKYSHEDWGPKPFRFNNFWLDNKKLVGIVESFWETHKVEGWMGFVLKEKLKTLKTILKEWHKEEYGGLEARIEGVVVDIKDLDVRGELVGLSSQEVECRKEKFITLWNLLRCKEALTVQRSRSKWLKEGDANTKFFHNSVKMRSRLNAISAIKVNGEWMDSPSRVKEAVSSFFDNHFSSPMVVRPRLDGVALPRLSEAENDDLISPFSMEEIEEVVRCSDGNKSPGPDGFNFAFVKNFWNLLKGDIRILFDQFHGNSCLPKSFLSYFVTLIPKVCSPNSLSDFRPISLLGCLYKIIAKVLTKRLARVMDSIISPTQSAFIKGRNLVDGVLVVNEVVDWVKKQKKECIIFKVDFEKAYDSVDWSFLDYMLRRLGFCEKWIDWIRACVFAGNLSVLVNGSPTGEINIQRGLKQGDPLAPFLFLIVAEGFSGVMRKAVELGWFRGLSVGSDPVHPVHVSHLQYADDTICIGEATVENLWSLKAILRGFEMTSGLKVNFWKSGLCGLNVTPIFMEMACNFLNCRLGTIPFKYLGLQIGANPKCVSTWDPLLEHLRKRLFSWRNKYISLGGRIVLINAVLNSIPIFYLSFYKLPTSVWKKVVRIQREFLWGGVKGGKRISWVKWSVVCKERRKGGLGVRDIRLVNISLLSKWRWRLIQPERSLWKEILVAKYGSHIINDMEWGSPIISPKASWWWKNIMALDKAVPDKNWLLELIRRKVGNGANTHFWTSKWLGEAPLALKFPRLYSLSSQKEGMVLDLVVLGANSVGWNFTWRRALFQWEEDLVLSLRELLDGVVLSPEEDCWKWSPSDDGNFSVNSAYKFLAKELNNDLVLNGELEVVFDHLWESPAPSKVIAFSWQLLYDRIPTRHNLQTRGIGVSDHPWECLGCVGKVENSNHLFLHCPCAMKIWCDIFSWLRVHLVIPPSLSILFEMVRGSTGNLKMRKGLVMIWHATLWSIWKARNKAIFSGGKFLPQEIVEEIKVLSWKWSLGRLKIYPCLFYEWLWEPGDCLLR
ncbi:hypothetical protein QL285_072415 [Trifolium repens]|nr:hypothetical protein QL285_072415 [Trifolium repens]